MRGLLRWPPQKWVFGLIALSLWLLSGLVFVRLVSTREDEMWVSAASYLMTIGLAAWGFPSWPSILVLGWVALSSATDYIVTSAEFQTVLWLAVTIVTTVILRRHRGAPALLLLIGSASSVVLSALHAFYYYTQTAALDAMAWRHWSFECLARVAGTGILCLPIGLALFMRQLRGRI